MKPTLSEIREALNGIRSGKLYCTTLNRNFYVSESVYEVFVRYNFFWYGECVSLYYDRITELMKQFSTYTIKVCLYEHRGVLRLKLDLSCPMLGKKVIHRTIYGYDFGKGTIDMFLFGRTNDRGVHELILCSSEELYNLSI